MSEPSSDMGLVVVGAAGRMGQTLIRTIASIPGVKVAAAIERKGSSEVGRDAGELAGLGPIGVTISDDPLPAFARADGVLDFTEPAATVASLPTSTSATSAVFEPMKAPSPIFVSNLFTPS